MKNIGFPFNFEDTYSHGKRFHFIKRAIEDYCRKKGKNKEQIKILDVGCGTGVGITFPIASLGYNIVGLDIDEDSIKWASKNNVYPNAKFEAGFLEELPNLTNFDVIICSEVLEHTPDPRKFLLLLKSRLKLDGIIILTVPNGYGWFEWEKLLYEKLGLRYLLGALIKLKILPVRKHPLPLITLNKKDRHLQRFTYSKICHLFNSAGLKVVGRGKAGLFGGPISETFLWWCRPFLKFNNWLGDHSLNFMVLGWYFVLKINITKIKSNN